MQKPGKNVILIPGMLGAGCTSVATKLAEALGLRVVNSEVIIRRIVVEKGTSFLELAKIVSDGEVEFEKLIRNEALDFIEEGEVVVEGRTALMLLDQPVTLKVFLHAEKDFRAKRVAERRQIDIEEALREIERSDEDRRRLVEKLYGKSWLDLGLYDVVINTSRIPVEVAAKIIETYLQVNRK